MLLWLLRYYYYYYPPDVDARLFFPKPNYNIKQQIAYMFFFLLISTSNRY